MPWAIMPQYAYIKEIHSEDEKKHRGIESEMPLQFALAWATKWIKTELRHPATTHTANVKKEKLEIPSEQIIPAMKIHIQFKWILWTSTEITPANQIANNHSANEYEIRQQKRKKNITKL